MPTDLLRTGRREQVRLLLRSKEAALALGISERHLWELTHRGELVAIRLPGTGARSRAIRFVVGDLVAWIDAQREGVAAVQDGPVRP
jgi:excisionase family DNA binding protein